MNIEQLVNDYPNDMELGKKVRELYREGRKFQDNLSEKMKDAKIFESPDGGRTIYVRGWGGSVSERKMITDKSQMSLFPDEVEYTDEYFKPNYKK
jgi:hypothetical protein